MSDLDQDDVIRRRLQGAVDPLVPDANAQARVARAVRDEARLGRGRLLDRLPAGVGALAATAVIFAVVGGGLGLAFGLRLHTENPAASPSPAAAQSSGTPACDGTVLSASIARTQQDSFGFFRGQGGSAAVIELKNTGKAACTLDGFAGIGGTYQGMKLAVVATHGNVIAGFDDERKGAQPPSKPIAPGSGAYFAVVEYGSGGFGVGQRGGFENTDVCPAPVTLLITPPHGSHAVSLATGGNTGFCVEASFGIALDETALSATPTLIP